MTMNDYTELAYRKAVLLQLVEDLKNHYPDDTGSSGQIYCEDVPYKDRKVPVEALASVEDELDKMIKVVNSQLAGYSMQKREINGDIGSKAAAPRKSRKVTRRKSTEA